MPLILGRVCLRAVGARVVRRTPVGITVFGNDLAEIERISIALEGMLRTVPGTRSTFAERQTGREYIDIIPDREAIARDGLTVRDVHDVIEAAVGGMAISTVIAGRSRFSVNVRYAADYRADPAALRHILIPVTATEPVGEVQLGGAGAGASTASPGMQAAAPSSSGMSAMGGGGSSSTSASGLASSPLGWPRAALPTPTRASAFVSSVQRRGRWQMSRHESRRPSSAGCCRASCSRCSSCLPRTRSGGVGSLRKVSSARGVHDLTRQRAGCPSERCPATARRALHRSHDR